MASFSSFGGLDVRNMPPSILVGESASKPSRSAGCKKGKHRRKMLPVPLDSHGAKGALGPPGGGEVQNTPLWCPGPASPHAPGLSFPAAVMVPSPAPYLAPAFPLPAVTSLGGEHAASVAALDCLPLSSGLRSFPALPAPHLGTFMTVFLPAPPVCPLSAPSFSPYPFREAPGSLEIPPSVSAMAPSLEAPSPAVSHRQAADKWEAQSGEPAFLSSRSSSPLQLNLLQEDTPRSCESAEQLRRDMCPEAECVSGTSFQHASEKSSLGPLSKRRLFPGASPRWPEWLLAAVAETKLVLLARTPRLPGPTSKAGRKDSFFQSALSNLLYVLSLPLL